MKTRRAKPARSTGCEVFGILNPYGNIWTWETFHTEAAAQKHLSDFWKGLEDRTDLGRFKIIRVKVTVSDGRAHPAGEKAAAGDGR